MNIGLIKLLQKNGDPMQPRGYIIAKTGYDGEIIDPFVENVNPHERKIQPTNRVLGSFAPVRNAYDISQVLSWIVSQRETMKINLLG